MRFVAAAWTAVIALAAAGSAASACGTFGESDPGPSQPDASPDGTTPATDGDVPDAAIDVGPDAKRFCATYVPITDAGACLDFDDGKLPDTATGWVLDINGGHLPGVVAGGAHASAAAMEIEGTRASGGATAGTTVRRAVNARPKTLTLTVALFLDRLVNETYDVVFVAAGTADTTYYLELELVGDGTINLVEYRKKRTDAGIEDVRNVASFGAKIAAQKWIDLKLEIVVGNGTSTATVSFDGVPTIPHEIELHTMTSVSSAHYGDDTVNAGIDYRLRLDDLTFEMTR